MQAACCHLKRAILETQLCLGQAVVDLQRDVLSDTYTCTIFLGPLYKLQGLHQRTDNDMHSQACEESVCTAHKRLYSLQGAIVAPIALDTL